MRRLGYTLFIIAFSFLLMGTGCHKKAESPSKHEVKKKKEFSQKKQFSPGAEVRTVDIRNDYVLGNPDAKVVVVEFTDFQCPFCRRFHHQTFPLLKENYIDKGLVKWVVKNFPLRFHQFAFPAARGLVCAGELGGRDAFWKYYFKIFNVEMLNPSSPAQVAEEIGLDREKFGRCLDSEEVKDKVAESMRYGSAIGIRGTPTFIIGKDNGDGTMTGEMVVGAQPYEVFKNKIDSLLAP